MNIKRIEVYNIVMGLREQGLGRRRIARKLSKIGLEKYSSSIQNWLNGMKPRLKKFDCNDELTKEKAFIFGVIGPGDGYIRRNEIGLAVIDKDFAEKFRVCLERVYSLKCSMKKESPSGLGNNPRHRVILYSRNAVIDLRNYGVKFKEGLWRVPEIIKTSTKDIKSEYVAGFCDSQGGVGNRCITVHSKNREGLKEIKCLFDDIGLRTKIRGNNLNIQTRKSLEFFYYNIGFSIQRKQEKLLKLINNYKRDFKLSEEIDLLIPEIKEYLNEGFSQRKIASILGISTTGIKNRIAWGLL